MAFSPQQKSIAQRIIAVGHRLGAGPKATLAALETGIVESGLRNTPGGDQDSQGVFQQRPSQGWTNPTNVEHAARAFFEHAIPLSQKYGSAGQLAQAVQRSAFPGRYDQQRDAANSLLGGIASRRAAASPIGGESTANQAIDADNEQARRRAIVAQLIQKRDPNSLLLKTGVLDPNPTMRPHVAQTQTQSQEHLTTPTSGGQGGGNVVVAPGAERAGVGLQRPIIGFLHRLSAASGRTVTVTTGTNHNQFVAGEPGVQSDHWTGNAADLGVGGDARSSAAAAHKGDLIAAHAIQLGAGVNFEQALQMARKGGVFNFQTPAGRLQILWRTNVGGDHFNHVHVGLARK